MESEEVKDIKEKLKEEIFIANSFGDKIRKVPTKELEKILALINEFESENERLKKDCAGIANDYQEMGGFYYEEAQKNQQLKDKVTELESENKELRVVVDIANERTYRKKFTDEWRKEYQKELDKQGNGHIAGHPDFDLVYKLYFEQKDRIAELEKENAELKEHVTEVEKGIINIAKERNKKDELASKFIDSYNDSLKDFTEKLKNKLFEFFQDNEELDGKISVGVLYVDVIGVEAKDGTIISLGLIDRLLKEYEK